jgi:hypothetical protein
VKDSITADLEAQIRNLQREVTTNNYPPKPVESTVSRIEYEKVDQELISTKKRFEGITTEVMKINRNNFDLNIFVFRLKQKMH